MDFASSYKISRKSDKPLWSYSKNIDLYFPKWRPFGISDLKFKSFGNMSFRYSPSQNPKIQNFIRILSLKYGAMTICKMAVVHHFEFSVWQLWHLMVIIVGFRINIQNVAKIYKTLLSYGKKTTFYNMASVRHLELKVFSFGQTISVIVLIHSSVQTFIITWWYFTEIWRYNDFQDGGRLPC